MCAASVRHATSPSLNGSYTVRTPEVVMHHLLAQEIARLHHEELLRDAHAHRVRAAFQPRRRLRIRRRSHQPSR
jgi:hypothetical protein